MCSYPPRPVGSGALPRTHRRSLRTRPRPAQTRWSQLGANQRDGASCWHVRRDAARAAERPCRGGPRSSACSSDCTANSFAYVYEKTTMVRTDGKPAPGRIQERYLAVKGAREDLCQRPSATPAAADIARPLQLSEDEVHEATEAGDHYWPRSLDASAREDSPERLIPVNGGIDLAIDWYRLDQVLPRLDGGERRVLRSLFFEGCSQRQVAAEIEVSQMQVSRLLARALAKLHRWTRAA
jgi:Sigma-70, region 4